MSSKSDVRKLVKAEAKRLGFTIKLANGRWEITNPNNGRTGFIPLQAIGRGLDNYRAEIRALAQDHPAVSLSPMVAATDPDPVKDDATMPRDTYWSIDMLVEAARANGIRPYVSGGILHTPGPVEARPYVEMLQSRETEVIAHLTGNTTSPEGDDVPKIGETARVTRTQPRDIAADAEALWGLLRDAAREQGDKPLTNGGVAGVQWVGAVADVIKTVGSDWDAIHERDVRQYLNRTEHTRCHRPRANPPVWWIADTWNDGGLTVTKVTPKPAPKPANVEAAPEQDMPAGGPALTALIQIEQSMREAEQRAAAAELDRDEARRERDRYRKERDDLLVELDEMRAERDQARAELEAINAMFARLGGGR